MARRFRRALLLACLCGLTAAATGPLANAGAQAGPRFDVASVRVVQPGRYFAGGGLKVTPGRFRYADVTLETLIRYAYAAPQYEAIKGGPGWLHFAHGARRFVVEATFPPETDTAQVRAMLRALLADRFKLVIHSKAIPARVYELRTSGHPKFKPRAKGLPVKPSPCPPRYRGYATEQFRLTGTAAAFASRLSNAFKLPVVDKTNLKGRYFFSFCYVEPGAVPPASLGPPPPIEDAVHQQLGLILVQKKGEIKEYFVTHAEMPTPN